ncbi:hypothetical protein JQX13_05635 [Archangium violaceum]|uniref:RCC1 domain-containing protein n=1 Tax=Archangium violaceum TaxID=83451 RepID=UPI00193B9E86|nr:hypothetical protein [Archangium violaceum]QRK09614.1 hypothetical protein JQX13_05635 [Archangium violaceum]
MYGQLGDGTSDSRSSPVLVPGVTEVKTVAAGESFSLALREDGTVMSWGRNLYRQLGHGDPGNINIPPAQVEELTGVVAVSAGANHALALREDGTVWAWGDNSYGQVAGEFDWMLQFVPGQVPGLSGVTAVAAGLSHSLALREDGTVWAWGSSSNGQLGNGTTGRFQNIPEQVPGLTDVVAISSRGWHSLALRADGTVWTWGHDILSQVGSGALHLVPVQVPGLTGVAISAGSGHSLVLSGDGTAVGWGANRQGALGNGESNLHLTPARTLLPCRFTGMPSWEHRASARGQSQASP